MPGTHGGGRARQEKLNGFALDRRGEGRWIGLKLRGLLALSEVRASRAALILVEEVVDEVRGEGEQVDGEQAFRQGDRDLAPALGAPENARHLWTYFYPRFAPNWKCPDVQILNRPRGDCETEGVGLNVPGEHTGAVALDTRPVSL